MISPEERCEKYKKFDPVKVDIIKTTINGAIAKLENGLAAYVPGFFSSLIFKTCEN